MNQRLVITKLFSSLMSNLHLDTALVLLVPYLSN